MESQPPNDPNNNQNNNRPHKEVPFDGRGETERNEPMDIMGDMRDSPAVVIMFLVGVASWLLRERCVC